MIGSALNMEDSDGDDVPDGWQWDLTDAPLVTVHSKDMFWKIVWLNEGGEFKFAPQREWNGDDFGSDGEDATDEIYGRDNVFQKRFPIDKTFHIVFALHKGDSKKTF